MSEMELLYRKRMYTQEIMDLIDWPYIIFSHDIYNDNYLDDVLSSIYQKIIKRKIESRL